MSAACAVDWQAPWLAPLRPWAPLAAAADWPARLSAAARERGLATAGGLPLSFVAAGDAGDGAYEAHVAATGRVPSRAHGAGALHDRFNALMWFAWPRAKAALNAAQAVEIARGGVGPRRGPRRDALTLVDESGLVLACRDDAVPEAIARHDWRQALVACRAQWERGDALRPRVFGHALLEKLAAPYKGITAVVVVLQLASPADDAVVDAALDAALARWLADPALAPRRLLHLPVLGIPGWWPANADPAFYDDRAVFRPLRRAA